MHCFLDYENEQSCEHAIRIENNRKVDKYNIVVQRCTGSGTGTGANDVRT